jgi:hypothetical protein
MRSNLIVDKRRRSKMRQMGVMWRAQRAIAQARDRGDAASKAQRLLQQLSIRVRR